MFTNRSGYVYEDDEMVCACLGYDISPDLKAKTNAKLIVTAVNAYDNNQETIKELVEALKLMIKYHEEQNILDDLPGFINMAKYAISKTEIEA